MSAKRQAAKRDANEPEIIAALKGAGCSVQDLSGGGIPDLLVGFADIETGELKNVLIEVKNPDTYGKLNELQVKWHAAWKGQVAVIETADEALQLVGRMDRPQADESEGHDITLIEPITLAMCEPTVTVADVAAVVEPAAGDDAESEADAYAAGLWNRDKTPEEKALVKEIWNTMPVFTSVKALTEHLEDIGIKPDKPKQAETPLKVLPKPDKPPVFKVNSQVIVSGYGNAIPRKVTRVEPHATEDGVTWLYGVDINGGCSWLCKEEKLTLYVEPVKLKEASGQ